MKSALSLFVIGVATVNAGSVLVSSSGSSSAAGSALGLVSGASQQMPILSSGSAPVIAAQGGASASGSSTGGWTGPHDHAWEADCDDEHLEECHHDVHIGNAGTGASGNTVSNQYIVAAGQQVIPAQVITSSYILNATNTSHVEANSTTAVTQQENWNVTGALTN